MQGAYVYLLECADQSLYCGSTRKELDERLSEHQNGLFEKSYTHRRRPINLLWSEHFTNITDAIECERRIKGWSRLKKLAMVRGDWREVSRLSVAHEKHRLNASITILRQAQDEVEGVAAQDEDGDDILQNNPS
jgi:putative endonuclease